MSQLFASGGQRIGASASVLPMNFQGWFLYTWYFFDTCNWDLGDQWWGRRQLYSCMFVLKLPWFLGVPQIYIQGLSWWLKTTQNKTEQKNLPANEGDIRSVSLIHGLGRFPGGGNGNPLQYSCLDNPMDRGTWQATVHGVTKSQTWPK